ncbi:hypothetical protein D356_01472 [Enterococcus faecium SD2A-2]|uniref:Uncharacterized protein n=1 Tax=Enterococcus faecium SD2A-2 TaxID=1244154 RepID=A0AB73A9B8_ENTFC|nr:hypothetical protein D356_01472 [Enterococcus faecium SD2A-2]
MRLFGNKKFSAIIEALIIENSISCFVKFFKRQKKPIKNIKNNSIFGIWVM